MIYKKNWITPLDAFDAFKLPGLNDRSTDAWLLFGVLLLTIVLNDVSVSSSDWTERAGERFTMFT